MLILIKFLLISLHLSSTTSLWPIKQKVDYAFGIGFLIEVSNQI